MEEEVNGRQRQLEREIACLKDTIWRLTSRVCVVESFLKNKYGNIYCLCSRCSKNIADSQDFFSMGPSRHLVAGLSLTN